MIIDTHVHLVGTTPAFLDLADKIKRIKDVINLNSRHPEMFQARHSEAAVDISDELIKDLDRHGLDRAIIQQTTGRGTNDMVAETVKKHPDRLFGLVRVRGARGSSEDQPSEEELASSRARAAEEVARGIEELGLIGVDETTPRGFSVETHPEKIARDMKPIMDMVSRYKVPIQFPTGWSQYPGGLMYADPVWTDDIAGRYPDVPVILTKMGRGLHHFDTALSIAMRNTNVYFDTVGTIGEHIRIAVDTIGADRIMFGSDWSPTWRWLSEPSDLYTMRKKTLDDANLSATEREQIEWRTASTVFSLDLG